MSSRILDGMRDMMSWRHFSIRTEFSYCDWEKLFVLYFNMKTRDNGAVGYIVNSWSVINRFSVITDQDTATYLFQKAYPLYIFSSNRFGTNVLL